MQDKSNRLFLKTRMSKTVFYFLTFIDYPCIATNKFAGCCLCKAL